jgi:S-DNA-T family DNA segregation ATPase FtsK/SpoIIIE
MSKNTRVPGQSAARKTGWEWRAAAWIARHPLGTLAAPAALTYSTAELGMTPTGCVVGGVAAGMGAWYRAHPASFDTTVGPWLRSHRRRWTTYVGHRWTKALTACDLVKHNTRTDQIEVPRIVRVRSTTPSIDRLTVRMIPGQTPTLFEEAAERLAHAVGAERVAVDRIKPGWLALVIEWRNPFTYIVAAPPIPGDAADVDLMALPVGEDEYGNPFTIPLAGRNLLVAGTMGSGKGSLLWSPLRAMGPAIRDGLVRVRVIDLKGGMETDRGRPLFHRWAANVADALEVLTEFRDDMRTRQATLKEAGLRKATVTVETPLELLLIDELAMLSAYADRTVVREAMALLGEIQTQGRAPLFSVAAYVQEPSKDIVDTRDLFTDRVCLAVTSDRHVDMVLGDGARDRGALADHIPLGPDYAGIGFVVDQHSRRPRRIRVGYVTDTDIDELVRTCSVPRLTRRRSSDRPWKVA